MSEARLPLSRASGAFCGRYLERILEVIVHVGSEQYALPDTAILAFDDGLVQVLVDVHEKVCLPLMSLDDVTICGDYEDRTEVTFRTLNTPAMFKVSRVFSIWEGSETHECGNLVGLLLADAEDRVVLGMNAHLDDLLCVRPDVLWNYVNAILPSSGALMVRE